MIEVHQSSVTPEFLRTAARDINTAVLIELDRPKAFQASLPPEFQPPTNSSPLSGLPPHFWIGAEIRASYAVEDTKTALELFSVRARLRWIRLSGRAERNQHVIADLFDHWRCSSCGHLSTSVLRRCPHAKVLCGDASIVPQIHWLRLSPGSRATDYVLDIARSRGIVCDPDIPKLPDLDAQRRRQRAAASVIVRRGDSKDPEGRP